MFQKQLERLSLPPTHRSGGKEYYLDPIREKLILKTPEETVRQQVLQYLKMVFTFYFNTPTVHFPNQQLFKEINQNCKHKIQRSDSLQSLSQSTYCTFIGGAQPVSHFISVIARA